ncbi:MAG: SWIM zinc finger family protein [Promethearchaeota archaeon]
MQDPKNNRRKREEIKKIKANLINYAKTSWGQMWIHSILKVGRPFRMQRGIEYAKDEQRIENLRINKGQIFAMVQGTAPTPYRVKVLFKTIPDEIWKKIIKRLANRAINIVKLLEGQIPEEIISIFESENFPLFIDAEQGLNATCSCPDQAIPCKHIAAVILYIARVLDFDPFVLLKIRGKTKKELLTELNLSKKSKKSTKKLEEEKEIEFSFDVPKLFINKFYSPKISQEEGIQIGFKFKRPGDIIEILDYLGNPPNLENSKVFETVFNIIYKSISAEFYKFAIESEKN